MKYFAACLLLVSFHAGAKGDCVDSLELANAKAELTNLRWMVSECVSELEKRAGR